MNSRNRGHVGDKHKCKKCKVVVMRCKNAFSDGQLPKAENKWERD